MPTSSTLTMEAREGRLGNAFACERCRKHKVRCVPSDINSTCQRCQKAQVECTKHVARRKIAKSSSDIRTPHRLRDFDKKLDKLSAIVATMATSPPPSTLPLVATLPSQLTETSEHTRVAQSSSAPSIFRTSIPPSPGPESESSLHFWNSMNDTLSCLGQLDPVIRSIRLVHMQMLLDTYRSMVTFFPFVALPNDCSCRDLLQGRPMLMFAALTVASHDSVLLQLRLSREFRKLVMVKIMNGEKNLDLLQGMLIFIAWHHHYMDAQAVSVPILLQLCVAVAYDLGLDSISTTVRTPLQHEYPRDREAKRAYLGCYYLASNIGLMDPCMARSMPYSSILRNYASELASACEQKSDAALPLLVDVCQFMADVKETFHNQPEQALVARTQVKRLNDKWDNIRLASTPLVSDLRTLEWFQLAARVYLYKTAADMEFADSETPWASGFHLSLRMTYLRSIEQCLDNSTKLPSGEYPFLALIDWLNLVSATTSLSKLALRSSPTPGWDPTELQIAKSFEYYRDQLAAQMPQSHDTPESHVFERFRRITAAMKLALRNAPGRGSPSASAFELATGSGRTVSLLQDLPLARPNGTTNGVEKLSSLQEVDPLFDVNSNGFHWRFLMGTV